MARVILSSQPDHVFYSAADISAYILQKVAANTKSTVGTELELFLTDADGGPATFDAVETVFIGLATRFKAAEVIEDDGRIVGVSVPGIGDYFLEPGGQVEIATKPAASIEALATMQQTLRAALDHVAAETGLTVTGRGHMPAFMAAEDIPRARFMAYYRYCDYMFGPAAHDLVDTMKSVCGLQVNLDPQGEAFHEVYRALMLVDLALSFENPTERQERLHYTYAILSPEQLMPVFAALQAQNNTELTEMIVDRLLTIKVPFLPDPSVPEGFASTIDIFGEPPAVGTLLSRGQLTAQILDNALGLQLTMPNLRRHGVLETRALDSVNDTAGLVSAAALYQRVAYDAGTRRALLASFKGVDIDSLETAFLNRFDLSATQMAAIDIGGGKSVGDLVKSVQKIRSSTTPPPSNSTGPRFSLS